MIVMAGFIYVIESEKVARLLLSPIDFRSCCCKGYAFINFLSPEKAAAFQQAFCGGLRLPTTSESPKICEVTFARVQGRKQNVETFRNSAAMGVAMKEFRPLVFKKGVEVPLPAPDGPIPPVRLRESKVCHQSKKKKKEEPMPRVCDQF